MSISRYVRATLVTATLFGAAVVPGYAQDCAALVDDFNRAVNAGREGEAQQAVDKIATDAQCGRFQVPAQRRLAAFRLDRAQSLMAQGRPVGDYDRLLADADKPEVLWKAAAMVGHVRFGERRFVDAAMSFDRAIEIVKNEARTPEAPSKFEIEDLVERAAQSRLLAANAAPGQQAFVRTARDQRDGTLGGVYSRSVRGVIPRAVPVPITFEFAKTTFTGIGDEAARELLTAVREQRPSKIVLVGHTDVRGSAETNMKLSHARAQAVSAFLRQHGIDIPVETDGKGANEPMRLSDPSGLTQDDIYALNRRVEWRRD